MSGGSKFKPLVVVRSYEDRECSHINGKVAPLRSSPVIENSQRVSPPKQNGNIPTATPPPPPPPPPLGDTTEIVPKKNGPLTNTSSPSEKSKPPPVPVKYSSLSTTNRVPQKSGQPPPCPMPDYDNLNINSNSTLPRSNSKIINNKPDIKTSQVTNHIKLLNNNSSPNGLSKTLSNGVSSPKCPPPPPNFNVNKIDSESLTLKKRPVSVVIGEYPSETLRKQPGKLDFLQNGSDEVDRSSQSSGDSISSQLASELAQTLSRSNLKRRTESVENLLSSRISSQSNGTVTISVGSNLVKTFARSTDNLLLDNRENKIKSSCNRVTISIGPQDKIYEYSNNMSRNGNGQ